MNIEFTGESDKTSRKNAKQESKRRQFEQQQKLILETFAQQIKTKGLRAVSMANLAKGLGISTKTLYKHFPTKSALIDTVINEKSNEANRGRSRRIMQGMNAHQRIEIATLEWFEQRSELGERFLDELARDFPESFNLYQQHLTSFIARSAKVLKPEIRKELNKDYALSVLWEAINQTPSSEDCKKFGLEREQALSQTIDIWAQGSLKTYQTT